MFEGMIGAYASYQMSGLTTGFPMGFPQGPPFGFYSVSQRGMTATQPAVPSISPGAPAIQPSSLRVPQASSYHTSAVTNIPVASGRLDVKISWWSIGPPRKPFDHHRLGNQPPQHRNSNRNRGRGYSGRGGAYGRSDKRGGGRGGGHGAGRCSGVDVIVTGNGETAPGTVRRVAPDRPPEPRPAEPGSEGEPKSAKKTRNGQQKPNHTHGPARASNRERRSQSDMEVDE
ncbi:hypothetical protein RvY_10109 [Ramazzottius varieornatus]|uniref:Uncharacterized protein n=1 Tax=Ramazzottius varieornatus TaxID=947166 RepID=A0A1D1VBP1_RAMVA|nr:hypothetical protein RvY_10109 [Ramazzottius varieornatus]